MTTPAQQAAATPPQSNDAWVPVLAGAFGLLGAAIASFLSTGFTSIAGLVSTIGSIAPADARLGSTVGLALVLMLSTIAAIPIARRQIHNDVSRVPAMAAGIAVVALVLAFPPVQWLTFGRPDPAAGHHHDRIATTENEPHDHGEQPSPAGDDGHHEAGDETEGESEGDEHAPSTPGHDDDSDGHDHTSDEP